MVMILAHRGASRVAPENTVEAFRAARRLEADGVELDVRATLDGALVVHHDVVVAGLGPIARLRLADLPGHIPTLAMAIDACGDLIVNIELKGLPTEPDYDFEHSAARRVVQFIGDEHLSDRVILSSFDLLALDAARDEGPAAAGPVTAWLTPGWFDQAAALRTVIERGHRALHPHHDAITEDLVAAAHAAGITVTTWTADDPAEIRRLAAAGVDGIITNVPDVARAALAG